jgi:hypothetical protein
MDALIRPLSPAMHVFHTTGERMPVRRYARWRNH